MDIEFFAKIYALCFFLCLFTDFVFGDVKLKPNTTKAIDYEKFHSKLESIGDQFLHKSMFRATQQVSRAISRTNHRWRKENIWDDPHQLLRFFKQPPNSESIALSQAGDVFDVTLSYVQDQIQASRSKHPKHHLTKRRVNGTDFLSADVIIDLMEFSGCRANVKPVSCSKRCLVNKYRTLSGICNNKENPFWGATNNILRRWLPAEYENNFNSPKGWEDGFLHNNFELPLVRKVSNEVVSTVNSDVTNDPDYSHLLVVWGQYIDHDMDFTPQSLSTSTFQGLTDCKKTCEKQLPCFPILVPEDDERIRTRRCIPFFRSAAVCGSGHTSSLVDGNSAREQINSINSFIDASTVYGNSLVQSQSLRNKTHKSEGLLEINQKFTDDGRDYMPFNPKNPCVQDRFDVSGEVIPCFKAGDGRASEHQTLAIIHTLWVREHNRIAKRLKRLNPHWSGEIIYEEARKIVGAYHQIVNWKEYLPKILGQSGMNMMGNFTGYNASTNPSISNVFATAAFRFGHVTIHPEFRRLDENFRDHPRYPTILLHEAFFASWRIIRQGGADPIIRGLIGRPAKLTRPDQLMHEELREKLFALQNKVALDLASLNLQRGRDHGLPGYNDWRVECGMPAADNFSMLANEISNKDVRDRLERLYGHPSNIDVWLGGLAEDLIEGARVGPLFQCLIARQFKALRDGDAFFYKVEGQFTPGQMETLESLTFARVICDNSGVDRVQPDVFQLGVFPQDFRSCNDIPRLDLSQWRESPEVENCGRPPSIENGRWKICSGDIVSYYCDQGFKINGNEDVRCESNGRFSDIPTCSDINECLVRNGGCEGICRNLPGTMQCSCPEGEISIGKNCTKPQPQPPRLPVSTAESHFNKAAVVIGSFFAFTLIGTVSIVVILLMKYYKAKRDGRNPMSRITFQEKPPAMKVFDNPGMSHT